MISKKRITLFIAAATLGFAALKIDLFPQQRTGCAFCDAAVLDRQEVFRGEFASILLTHKAIADGHLLVIPHRHAERYEELTGVEMREIGELVGKAQSAARSIFGAEEYLVLQKNGRGVGQTVPHVHIHVIPKTADITQFGFAARIFFRPLLKPNLESQAKYISALEESARLDGQAL